MRKQFVTGTDWFPTLAEWTGAKITRASPRRQVDHQGGQGPQSSDTTQATISWATGTANGSCGKSWKLYAKARENVRPAGIPEMNNADKKHFLVNLAKDPGEERNWAEGHPAELKRLQELAKKYQAGLEKKAK